MRGGVYGRDKWIRRWQTRITEKVAAEKGREESTEGYRDKARRGKDVDNQESEEDTEGYRRRVENDEVS